MSNIDVKKEVSLADQYCKTDGIRLTTRRRQVLNGLLASKKALSAYELVEVCNAQEGKSISPMSIYRILEFLESERLVHKLKLANKYVACAHINCNHAHETPQFLICGNCHRVEEVNVSASTMSGLRLSVEMAGFSLVSPQLEMNCLCNNCGLQEYDESREGS